jgi:hypothetical protein
VVDAGRDLDRVERGRFRAEGDGEAAGGRRGRCGRCGACRPAGGAGRRRSTLLAWCSSCCAVSWRRCWCEQRMRSAREAAFQLAYHLQQARAHLVEQE